MLSKENTVLTQIYRIMCDWHKASKEHQDKKHELIETYGWDSAEYKEWREDNPDRKFPLPQGMCKAYRAWENSIRYEEDEIEMDEYLWEKEVKSFIKTLRDAGFTTFVYTNQSTSVMENLHQFAAEGCALDGLCTILRHDHRWGSKEPSEIIGIRIRLS